MLSSDCNVDAYPPSRRARPTPRCGRVKQHNATRDPLVARITQTVVREFGSLEQIAKSFEHGLVAESVTVVDERSRVVLA